MPPRKPVTPYSDGAVHDMLTVRGEYYVAACPLVWLNLQFEPQPNVPKYATRIDNLRTHFFSSPTRYPVEVLVCHVRGEALPHENKTQLQAVCPPEVRDALRTALGMAVKDESDTLHQWRRVIQSIPIIFKVEEVGHLKAHSSRQFNSGRTSGRCTPTCACPTFCAATRSWT